MVRKRRLRQAVAVLLSLLTLVCSLADVATTDLWWIVGEIFFAGLTIIWFNLMEK